MICVRKYIYYCYIGMTQTDHRRIRNERYRVRKFFI